MKDLNQDILDAAGRYGPMAIISERPNYEGSLWAILLKLIDLGHEGTFFTKRGRWLLWKNHFFIRIIGCEYLANGMSYPVVFWGRVRGSIGQFV